jgi:predicted RNA-binding Zn ribbon-like protein
MAARGATERLPRLVGGRLCLDFANTIGGRGGAIPDEYLFDYPDLVAWARYVGVVDAAGAERLLAAAEGEPEAAGAVFDRAIALRETIYRLGSALAAGAAPPPADLDALRRAHLDAFAHARLVPAGTGLAWAWEEPGECLDRPLWPVVRSAVELLTSAEVGRIKECPGGGGGPCTWLFLDSTKNAARRWCSMAECGGEVKARRQTARRRAARAAGAARRA